MEGMPRRDRSARCNTRRPEKVQLRPGHAPDHGGSVLQLLRPQRAAASRKSRRPRCSLGAHDGALSGRSVLQSSAERGGRTSARHRETVPPPYRPSVSDRAHRGRSWIRRSDPIHVARVQDSYSELMARSERFVAPPGMEAEDVRRSLETARAKLLGTGPTRRPWWRPSWAG